MTAPVPVEIPATYHVGDGLTAAFLIGFDLPSGSSVAVTVNGVPQSLGPNYSVVGDQVVFAAPPETGWHIGILRRTPIGQSKAFPNQPTMRPQSVEDALSERARVDQELAEVSGRAMTAPIGEAGLILPRLDDRAGKLLSFDEDGNARATSFSTDDLLVDVGLVQEAADRAEAAAANAENRLDLIGGNAGSMVGLNFDAPFDLKVIGPEHEAPSDGIYVGSGGINLSLETFISSPVGAADSDNQRAMLALVATTRDGGNSEEQTLLVMTRIRTGFVPEFIPNHYYAKDSEFRASASNNVYHVTTAGTSGATPPTGKGVGIANGPNSLVVKWINDAAINAKAGGYFETIIEAGAGAAWGQANNVEVHTGSLSPFAIGYEFDFTNNSGIDSTFGGLNRHNLFIATNGPTKSTSAIELVSNNTSSWAAFWQLHIVGSKAAENALICIDANSAHGIGFGAGAGGVVTPVFSVAAYKDCATAPKGLVLDGQNGISALEITATTPAAIAVAGAKPLASFYDLAVTPKAIILAGLYGVTGVEVSGSAPSAYSSLGAKTVAGFLDNSVGPVGFQAIGDYAVAAFASNNFEVNRNGRVTGNSFRALQLATIANSAATGAQGQILFDADHIYVCGATNSWKRAALTAF